MRRQTLFLIPAFLGALFASGAIALPWLQAVRAAAEPEAWRPAEALGLSFRVPPGTSAPAADPGDPWTAMDYRAPALGTLRIGRERPRSGLQPALREWFGLSDPLEAPVIYRFQGRPAQVRPVIAFGPSALAYRRQGRWFAAVCVFDLDGHRYWIQARSANASRASLACFHQVLASLRGPDGTAADPALVRDLRDAEADLAPGLVPLQPWGALLPVGVLALLAGVFLAVGRRSGRPPRRPETAGSRYDEAPVEVLLAVPLQRKYFDAALEVAGDRLVLYTFGTPFLSLPLDALPGRVAEKAGWFGPPSLEFTLEGCLDFHKQGWMYRAWKARKVRLRIYTRDVQRLRVALGA